MMKAETFFRGVCVALGTLCITACGSDGASPDEPTLGERGFPMVGTDGQTYRVTPTRLVMDGETAVWRVQVGEETLTVRAQLLGGGPGTASVISSVHGLQLRAELTDTEMTMRFPAKGGDDFLIHRLVPSRRTDVDPQQELERIFSTVDGPPDLSPQFFDPAGLLRQRIAGESRPLAVPLLLNGLMRAALIEMRPALFANKKQGALLATRRAAMFGWLDGLFGGIQSPGPSPPPPPPIPGPTVVLKPACSVKPTASCPAASASVTCECGQTATCTETITTTRDSGGKTTTDRSCSCSCTG